MTDSLRLGETIELIDTHQPPNSFDILWIDDTCNDLRQTQHLLDLYAHQLPHDGLIIVDRDKLTGKKDRTRATVLGHDHAAVWPSAVLPVQHGWGHITKVNTPTRAVYVISRSNQGTIRYRTPVMASVDGGYWSRYVLDQFCRDKRVFAPRAMYHTKLIKDFYDLKIQAYVSGHISEAQRTMTTFNQHFLGDEKRYEYWDYGDVEFDLD